MYLLTLQDSRYCVLALQSSIVYSNMLMVGDVNMLSRPSWMTWFSTIYQVHRFTYNDRNNTRRTGNTVAHTVFLSSNMNTKCLRIACSVIIAIAIFYFGSIFGSNRNAENQAHSNGHQILLRPEAKMDVPDRLLHVPETIPDENSSLSKNYYITQKGYAHRLNTDAHVNSKDPFWQLPVYVLASETCRMLDCKVIIDIGCGSPVKLSILPGNVKKICVETPAQVKLAAPKYKDIQFIEADLAQAACKLEISQNYLDGAVVIVADTIQQLRNPFVCLLPLLHHMTQKTKAVVVSSPDRSLLYKYMGAKNTPTNKFHVREWTLAEAETMLLDHNMFPIVSGRVCNHPNLCVGNNFLQKTDRHATWVTVNVNLAKVAEQVKQPPRVTVLLIVYTSISENLIKHVINYYNESQKASVKLIDISNGASSLQAQYILNDSNELAGVIEKESSGAKEGDWYILADANEIILTRGRHTAELTLSQYLAMSTDCNALQTTTVFSHTQDGKAWTNLPFKVHMPQGWNVKKMTPPSEDDLLSNGIRIWKYISQNEMNLSILNVGLSSGARRVRDVSFRERHICPFRFTSVRYSPKFVGDSVEVITPYIEQMYGVHLAIGFMPVNRSTIIENQFLY